MNRFKLLLFFIFPIIAWSCRDFDNSPKALVNILLIDAPAQWDSVIVEIQGVELEFVANGREAEITRIFLPYEPGDKTIDISLLVGGRSLLLGRSEMQLGVLTGISLRLGTENSLYQKDNRFPLTLPQGINDYYQPLSIQLEGGFAYDLVLDFDLAKSIQVINPSPLTLNFNPTIQAFSGIGKGELTGSTSPAEIRPVIYAISAKDSISTHTNSSGNFLFRLEPGTYNIFIDPKDERYNSATLFDVNIEPGKKTPLERITLTRK
ncbi:DUF4382 domain-containing protein [Algoriphagus sp.]|uniref:DUF4382 domain-containing protein n=1 Tax=Algoriphagus sp. TaxID=1872435 RepID=UPI00391B8663